MASLKRLEGYLIIDNRCSGGTMTEEATATCAHCHAVVRMNPFRTRPRHYCAKCDHYVCDHPTCLLECRPFNKVLDDAQAVAFRAEQAQKSTIYLPTGDR